MRHFYNRIKKYTQLSEVAPQSSIPGEWIPCWETKDTSFDEEITEGVAPDGLYAFYKPIPRDWEAKRVEYINTRIRANYSVGDELKLTNEAIASVLAGNPPSDAYLEYRGIIESIKAESVSYKNSLQLAEQQRLIDWQTQHSDVDFSEEAIQAAIDALPVIPEIVEELPPEPEFPVPLPFFVPHV